jgi:polyisoprenoid-binding protein YceI
MTAVTMIVLAVMAALAAQGTQVPPPPQLPAAGARVYAVEAEASTVAIHVGKSGLFRFAGHEHEVVAPAVGGEVVADARDLARSSVWVRFEAASLRVLAKGEPPEDVPKVQATMLGPKVLDVARFAEITFRSRSVSGRPTSPEVYELQVVGDLSLHGITRAVSLPLRVDLADDRLTATGRTVIRQTDFDIRPVSVAGVVNVRNEVAVDFSISARAVP